MQIDTVKGFKGLRLRRPARRPVIPRSRAHFGVASYGAGRVLRLVSDVEQPDGSGHAELDLDGKTGEVLRLLYQIETPEAGSVKYQSCEPMRDSAAVFLAAARSLLRREELAPAGGAFALRQVMEVAASLEAACVRTLQRLQCKPSRAVFVVC